ncbi:MAG: tetratricopeptide repeat protein [Planctomycetes bacterium]|nr:tetratricopeptide repeat protein [Planctomycetota bacterium]
MPAADSRERRTVTVLFSDLSGFTRLSEDRDPEEVADLIDALFQKFRAAVESHGGTVDKFIGDAVMAVFGAPVAHEDDALRAVLAGLALQQALDEFNRERGLDLSLRVGINTGEVLWGTLAGEKATVMGDAVNLAQRLEAAAEPGSVLVSRATEREARDRVRFRGLPAIQVKGRTEAVEPFEAVEELSGGTEVRTGAGAMGPLVGRDAELARLRDAAARGGFFVLTGEPGVGKSRLAAEVRQAVRSARAGIWVAVGRALEHARLPLGPFGDLVRAEAGVSGLDAGDAPRVVAAVAAELERAGVEAAERENLAHLVALSLGYAVPEARVRHLEPARFEAEAARAWERWLAARARGGPALLCFEDLQWADASTRALLEALAPRLAGRPLTILATARPEAALPAGFETLPLAALDRDGVRRVAEGVLGSAPSPDLLAFLVDQTGGNPYYVEELCRYLRESGLPARPEGMPANLQGLLVARLDSLAPEHKEAVKCASAIGRAFWAGFLAELLGRDVEEAIAEARRREMVFPQAASLMPGDRQYVFKHALLRDAAYSLLTRRDRARLHGAAAGRLAGLAGASGDRRLRALAASHWRDAGRDAEAAAAWLEAAGAARAVNALEETLEWARLSDLAHPSDAAALTRAGALAAVSRFAESRAVAEEALARDGSGPERLRLRLAAGRARSLLGDPTGALPVFDAVLAEGAVAETRLEGLRDRVVSLVALGRYDEAERAIALMFAEIEGPDPPESAESWRGYAFHESGAVHFYSNRFAEAEKAYSAALDIARRAGNLLMVASGTADLANVVAARGDLAGAIARIVEAERGFRAIGDRLGAATCVNNIGTYLHRRGDHLAALEAFNRALAERRDIGDRRGVATSLANVAVIRAAVGELDLGETQAREALEIRREIGDARGEAANLANLGQILMQKGDLPGAERACREAVTRYRQLQNRRGISISLARLGTVLGLQGDPAPAAAAGQEALDLARAVGDPHAIAGAHYGLLRSRFVARDFDAVARHAREARTLYASFGNRAGVAECLEAEAAVHSARGDHAAAVSAHREALALSRILGHRGHVAQILAVLAGDLARVGTLGEVADALEEALSEGKGTAQARGVAESVARIATEAAELARGRGETETEKRLAGIIGRV